MATTVFIDQDGKKHWGVMARLVAEKEGKKPAFEEQEEECFVIRFKSTDGSVDMWGPFPSRRKASEWGGTFLNEHEDWRIVMAGNPNA